MCRADQVQLSLVNSRTGKNDNSVRTDLLLTNVSTSNCEEQGFPGVSFADEAGAQIGSPATRKTGGETSLLGVPPGGHVTAEIDTLPGDGSACARPTYVVVYVPNSTEAKRIPNTVPLYYCKKGTSPDPQAPLPFAINPFRDAS
jgi:hypothetical protein